VRIIISIALPAGIYNDMGGFRARVTGVDASGNVS
jgi:hypothetical protein